MRNFIYSLLYWLFVTPIGLLGRLFGVTFIHKGFEDSKKSYWEKSDKIKRSKSDYYKNEY